MKKYDLVILFSGGADSRLMLEIALSNGLNPYCILIDYGQLNRQELNFAETQLEKKGIDHNIYNVNIPVGSGLTTGEKGTYDNVHEMHVPGRNLMFISLAASIAESKNINRIWLGADFSDRLNNFPDCYQEWVYRVNDVLNINGSIPINLEAPLLGMNKELILSSLENNYNVDIEKEIFSGYGDL